MSKKKDAATLRAARKARIAAQEAAQAEAEQQAQAPADDAEVVESAFNYNPLYSKPTSLGPNKPRGGYHYFGPPPDAGTTYGLFATASGHGLIAPVGDESVVHDPATGAAAKLEEKADRDLIATLLAAKSELVALPPCAACKATNLTSAAVLEKGFDALHCTACGEDMTQKVNSMKKETQAAEAPQVQFEILSSADAFDDLVESDVHMTLFDEDEANPYWNVDVKGMPVARVYLKDQPKPDEARSVFCSEQYYDGVSQAIARVGLNTVLSQLNARHWAAKLDESAKVAELRESVKAELTSDFDNKVASFRDKLLNCIAITCAGMDKNFWREEGNALKEALYASFRDLGIPSNAITAAIEQAFSVGSTPYFQSVLDRSISLMAKDDSVVAQLAEAIGEANVLQPSVPATEGTDLPVDVGTREASPAEASTLSDRLKRSNVALSNVQGSDRNSEDFGDMKSILKHNLGFGRR